jgi:hypothetical protein
MRKLGHTLLWAGFVWLLAIQFFGSMRIGIRPVVEAQYAKLSATGNKFYAIAEVERQIQETANATYELLPLVVVPGAVMLVGGLLLSRSTRRSLANDA